MKITGLLWLEDCMARNKTTISKAGSYHEIAKFWDTHDLADYWDKTKPVEFEVDIQSEGTYYAVENALSKKIRSAARKRGVSAETLLNLWVKESSKRSDPDPLRSLPSTSDSRLLTPDF